MSRQNDCTMYAELFFIIIRYVIENKIRDRFFGFFEVSEDKRVSKSAETVSNKFKSLSDFKTKLIIQTYDGGAVIAEKINDS